MAITDVVSPAAMATSGALVVLVEVGRRQAVVLVLIGTSFTSSQENEEEGEVNGESSGEESSEASEPPCLEPRLDLCEAEAAEALILRSAMRRLRRATSMSQAEMPAGV